MIDIPDALLSIAQQDQIGIMKPAVSPTDQEETAIANLSRTLCELSLDETQSGRTKPAISPAEQKKQHP